MNQTTAPGSTNAATGLGGEPTFPVMLYGRLRFGGQLPELIAMAVLLMLATVGLTLLALRLRRSPP